MAWVMILSNMLLNLEVNCCLSIFDYSGRVTSESTISDGTLQKFDNLLSFFQIEKG